MTDLLAARLQMAISLGFHIIFASIGMAMPFLMATSHYFWLKHRNDHFRILTKAWSRGVALFFAVGAVSGTVLSLELGLLWPEFMKHAGAIIGMPFSWEGTAFFVEAIALGLFLYGWKRLRPWPHFWCGVVVGLSGVASGFFVIAANGWMNAPQGFDWVDGQAINIDPVKAMFNQAFFPQAIHMTIAAFAATGFAVAGVHSYLYRRGYLPELHRAAIKIAFVWGAIASLLMPVSGHLLAERVAKQQPEKFAALEALFETQTYAPLALGGIPNLETRTLDYAIHIPGALSFLAHGDFAAEVKGLNDFPREHWPPVAIVHYAFQGMVAAGMVLAAVSLVGLLALRFKPALFAHPRFLTLLVALTPIGFFAIEAGWTVTEVGRQPWIIYKVMLTADALSPMKGLVVPFVLFILLYFLLTAVLWVLFRRQVQALHEGAIG